MSEQINKVLASTAQAFSTAEQKQARDNISAQAKITYSYSGSTITAIDGSAVGNPASLTGVDHDYNLSGSGTSAVPLGLASTVTFSGQSAGQDVSSLKINSGSIAFEVPSANTATMNYRQVKMGYEWPPALDVEHGEGFFSHGILEPGGLSLSAHNASYITHRLIQANVATNPYLSIYDGYGSGSNQTAIHLITHDDYRADPYIALNYSGTTEYVDQSSIRKWNSALPASASSQFLTGVSSNNNLSGDGTSGYPLGLNSQVVLFSSDASESGTGIFNGQGLEFTANPYTSTHYRMGGWGFYSNGDATHHHQVAANVSGIDLNWNTNYYVTNIHASGINQKDAWAPSRHSAEWAYTGATLKDYTGVSAIFQPSGITLCNSASGAGRTVSIGDIDRWNSYSSNTGAGWNESGNSLSTGYGGNQVTAASQFNSGAGNWAVRRVKMSGLPDQDLIGFQSVPNGNDIYGVTKVGAFVAVPQQHYFTYLYHKTGEAGEDLGTSFYPTGLTADARLDFVNLCSGMSANITHDTFHGATAIINPGESATMWYIATADIWTDGGNPVPV